MGPIKSRWLLVFALVLLCLLLIWWGRRAGAPESKASPGPVAPSAGEATPPSPKPVSWHVVVDSLALVPAPGLVAKMPAKLLLEGTPTGAPCHYRMNLYAGMNQMNAKEGELKPGESLEVPPGTETVAVQLDGVGKEGRPLQFRGIWRRMSRPHLEVVNGVAFILGEDGILRRLDLVKNPQGEPEVVPGVETFRFRGFTYLWFEYFHDTLWCHQDDNTFVALSEAVAKKASQAEDRPLRLYEPGKPLPWHPGWESRPFEICRLPTCRDEVLKVAPNAADVVGLAMRDHQSDGKATVLLADGRLFSLATKDAKQFQPALLEGNPFIVHLGGRWTQDKSGCGWGTDHSNDQIRCFWQSGNRLAGLVDLDGRVHGISERTPPPPEMGETEEWKPSLADVNKMYSSPAGTIACDELSGLSFDRAGAWFWDGQSLQLDPSLEKVVVRKLLEFPLSEYHPYPRPSPLRLLCLDADGVVRQLAVTRERVVQEKEWRSPKFVDIAVSCLGKNIAPELPRLVLPLLWALTAEGKPVCLDPETVPKGEFEKACLVHFRRPSFDLPASPWFSTELTTDVPGGLCAAMPAGVKVCAQDEKERIDYSLAAFRGRTVLDRKTGSLVSGEALAFPADATAVALEMKQGKLKRRILWTLDVAERPYPYLVPYGPMLGVQVIVDTKTVWNLDHNVMGTLVEKGLALPGGEVSVPVGKLALWKLQPEWWQYRRDDEEKALRLHAQVAQRLAPRTILRRSHAGRRFFQLEDGSLYAYAANSHALCQMPGWGRELRPAFWEDGFILDNLGRPLGLLDGETCADAPLDGEPIPYYSYQVYPGLENAFLAGSSLIGFWDVDGNNWMPAFDPKSGYYWKNQGPLPAGVAEIVHVPFDWGGKKVPRDQQLMHLMEDGSIVVPYPLDGKIKRIRIEGTSWKKPGPP